MMKCIGYRKKNGEQWPCGKCTACKINKARQWKARFIWETIANPNAAWITLTYAKEAEPCELSKQHLDKFIAKLRRNYPKKLKFFARGEYRPKDFAPHYHMILWNYEIKLAPDPKNPQRWIDPLIERIWNGVLKHSLPESVINIKKLQKTKHYGGTYTVPLQDGNKAMSNRFDYILEDIIARTDMLDEKWPQGFQSEFRKMSTNPGIGSTAILLISNFLMNTKNGEYALARYGTVPPYFRYNSKIYPIPEYIRERVASVVGIKCFTPTDNMLPFVLGIDSEGVIHREPATQQDIETEEEFNARAIQVVKRSERKAKHWKDKHEMAAKRLQAFGYTPATILPSNTKSTKKQKLEAYFGKDKRPISPQITKSID